MHPGHLRHVAGINRSVAHELRQNIEAIWDLMETLDRGVTTNLYESQVAWYGLAQDDFNRLWQEHKGIMYTYTSLLNKTIQDLKSVAAALDRRAAEIEEMQRRNMYTIT
jgi:hypothetical protein